MAVALHYTSDTTHVRNVVRSSVKQQSLQVLDQSTGQVPTLLYFVCIYTSCLSAFELERPFPVIPSMYPWNDV